MNRCFLAIWICISIMFMILPAKQTEAISISLPDISFDSLAVGGSGISYSSSTGQLSVNAAIQNIKWEDGTVTYPGGFVNYTLELINVTSSPGFTVGTFGNSSKVNDLLIEDGFGTLILSGEFTNAAIFGMNDNNIGFGEAAFTLTGGILTPNFLEACGGKAVNCGAIVSLNFNLSADFGPNIFDNNFTGAIKGDLAPVPEPGSLFLIGIGIFGIATLGRYIDKL